MYTHIIERDALIVSLSLMSPSNEVDGWGVMTEGTPLADVVCRGRCLSPCSVIPRSVAGRKSRQLPEIICLVFEDNLLADEDNSLLSYSLISYSFYRF